MYMTITEVERAFESMKTDLGTRPVYHQGAERTEAHLFLSILAYHMLKNIEYRLQQAGTFKKWNSLRRELSTLQRSVLSWQDSNKQTWFKKLSGKAEFVHQQTFSQLKISNPLQDHIYPAKV